MTIEGLTPFPATSALEQVTKYRKKLSFSAGMPMKLDIDRHLNFINYRVQFYGGINEHRDRK